MMSKRWQSTTGDQNHEWTSGQRRGKLPSAAFRPGGQRARLRGRHGSTITGGVAIIATIVMLPVALLFVIVWLAGWQLGFVQTGSMDPVLPTGSMIVSSPISADEAEVGMVMQFVDPRDNSRMITHRVIEVRRDDTGQLSFVTKGDANADRDTDEVPAENVRAEVRWHVKGLGSLLWAVRWPRSLGFTLVPLLLVGVGMLLGRREGHGRRRRDRTSGIGDRVPGAVHRVPGRHRRGGPLLPALWHPPDHPPPVVGDGTGRRTAPRRRLTIAPSGTGLATDGDTPTTPS